MASDTIIEALKIAVPNGVTLCSLVILYLNNRRTLELNMRRIGIEFFAKDGVAAHAEIVGKLLDFKDGLGVLKSWIDIAVKSSHSGTPEAGLEDVYEKVQDFFEKQQAEFPSEQIVSVWQQLLEAETELRKKMNAKRLFVSKSVWKQLIIFIDDVNCRQIWPGFPDFARFVERLQTHERDVDALIEVVKDDVLSQVTA